MLMKYWLFISNYSILNPIHVQYWRLIRNIPYVKSILRQHWRRKITKSLYCFDIGYIGSIFLGEIEAKLEKCNTPISGQNFIPSIAILVKCWAKLQSIFGYYYSRNYSPEWSRVSSNLILPEP